MFQPYQFPGEQGLSYPQHHTQNGIVLDTLRIIREIMQYGSNNQVPPVQYVRRIKRERSVERSNSKPAEVITLEEPETLPENESNKEEERKEEKKTENNEEEESGRTETKVEKPPTKARIKAMVKVVKNDEKKSQRK